MRCIEIRDQKLVMTERPTPTPGPDEVLVRVVAAGVNRPDILQRQGKYPPPPGVTDIPGLEIAGEIVSCGDGVKKSKIGTKVCALVAGGGYAEYCTVPVVQCLPLPKGMDFETAAAIPETFFTVWTNLFDRGRLKKGETVLIHGGASGIGTTAIQIAKAFGAKVFVTVGSDEKAAACKKLGASLAINYRTQHFADEVLKATKDKGVNVVIDMIGGDYLPLNLQCMAEEGRHVSIAMQHGRKAELDIFEVMRKRLILTGSTLRARSIKDKGAIADALYQNIWPLMHAQNKFIALFTRKRIRPVIDKAFSFSDAQAAHDYLDAGNHVGKVVLRIA